MVHEILRHETALGEHDGRLSIAYGSDGYDGRFPQRMDLFELRRCQESLFVAVEDLDLVRQIEFLEEPHDALGPRMI